MRRSVHHGPVGPGPGRHGRAGRPGGPRGTARVRGDRLGPPAAGRARRGPAPARPAHRGARRPPRPPADPRERQARQRDGPEHQGGGGRLPLLRGPGRAAPRPHDGRAVPELHDVHGPRADRRRRRHHAVEHAARPPGLEAVPGARGGQHRRRQAVGGHAASTLLLAELAIEAGVPQGVFNVVTGLGPTRRGARRPPGRRQDRLHGLDRRRAAHRRDRRRARRARLAGARRQVAADRLRRRRPNNAVNGVMAGVFAATGQTCIAGSRVLVDAAVYDEFAALLSERAALMRHGDPLDAARSSGRSRPSRSSRRSSPTSTSAKGEAELLAGGARPGRRRLLPPADGVRRRRARHADRARGDLRPGREPRCAFGGEEEGLRIANDTQFGLAAGVWTENVKRAHRVAPRPGRDGVGQQLPAHGPRHAVRRLPAERARPRARDRGAARLHRGQERLDRHRQRVPQIWG